MLLPYNLHPSAGEDPATSRSCRIARQRRNSSIFRLTTEFPFALALKDQIPFQLTSSSGPQRDENYALSFVNYQTLHSFGVQDLERAHDHIAVRRGSSQRTWDFRCFVGLSWLSAAQRGRLARSPRQADRPVSEGLSNSSFIDYHPNKRPSGRKILQMYFGVASRTRSLLTMHTQVRDGGCIFVDHTSLLTTHSCIRISPQCRLMQRVAAIARRTVRSLSLRYGSPNG